MKKDGVVFNFILVFVIYLIINTGFLLLKHSFSWSNFVNDVLIGGLIWSLVFTVVYCLVKNSMKK